MVKAAGNLPGATSGLTWVTDERLDDVPAETLDELHRFLDSREHGRPIPLGTLPTYPVERVPFSRPSAPRSRPDKTSPVSEPAPALFDVQGVATQRG